MTDLNMRRGLRHRQRNRKGRNADLGPGAESDIGHLDQDQVRRIFQIGRQMTQDQGRRIAYRRDEGTEASRRPDNQGIPEELIRRRSLHEIFLTYA